MPLSAEASEPVLAINSLCVEARSDSGAPLVLVDNVSFELRPGEVIGLIGESGAGKSTIGLAALGYSRSGCRITSGEILFKSADIIAMPPAQRDALRGRHIAYIAQSAAASFNPALRIYEQVCEVPVTTALSTTEEARRTAIRLFRELDLPNPDIFGNRYPHQVSGGQLQRAMAAMAMAAQPEILVFDEPTTALDVTTQVEVLAAFRKLIRDYRTAAIYIAHDLAVVAQVADRIMVLRHGRMVEFGKTRDILERPQQDYTKRLIGERAVAYINKKSAADEEPLLSVKGVTASYRTLPRVVHEVDLAVRRGDTLAIVGESGSGKSTLARVIVGLLPRQTGAIRFAGETLAPALKHRTKEQLRRIQMIYQMPDVALNPHHTVLETIARPMKFYFHAKREVIRERVTELLRQIELPLDYMGRKTSMLSGGQKQRLCIARALAASPDLIICDEVTSSLDQLVAEEILALLRRLQDTHNTALLFITHDLGTVRRFSKDVIVMKKGGIVDRGTTARVFAPPFHDYTALLLSSVPQMRQGWLDEALKARSGPRSDLTNSA
jgi:peptide/nickel transport system ATP-binding protein